MECNRTSSKYIRQKYPEIYNERQIVPDSFVEILAYARDIFLKHRVTIMLAGGTALGKFRPQPLGSVRKSQVWSRLCRRSRNALIPVDDSLCEF